MKHAKDLVENAKDLVAMAKYDLDENPDNEDAQLAFKSAREELKARLREFQAYGLASPVPSPVSQSSPGRNEVVGILPSPSPLTEVIEFEPAAKRKRRTKLEIEAAEASGEKCRKSKD